MIGEYFLKLINLLLFVTTLGSVCAQTSANLTASGYSAPSPLQVAPGQVVTFFFRGIAPLAGVLRNAQSTTVPLPTTLAGISMRISQNEVADVPIPIFAVRQENDCDVAPQSDAACLLTTVKLQIPYEIEVPPYPAPGAPPVPIPVAPLARLAMDVDGVATRSFTLQPVIDNAHVISSCDLDWDTKSTSVCERQAYHSDGHPVSTSDPARRGDTVIVYAYGLGKPPASVRTGDATHIVAPLESQSRRVMASFNNFVNTPSSLPRSTYVAPAPASPITFAGLAYGEVGLYQVNVPVPTTFKPAVPCGAFNGFVVSNATLFISTSQGVEPIGICVQP